MKKQNRMVKSWLALALVLVMALAMTACGAKAPNPEYVKFFEDHGIQHQDLTASKGKCASFVTADSDDFVDVMEYIYKGDVINTMRETLYIPVEGADEAGLEELASLLKEMAAEANGFDGIDAEWGKGSEHYWFAFTIEDLDTEEGIENAMESDLVEMSSSEGLLSMTVTRENMEQDGYIEK